jgi:hypothetical protein
VALYIVVRHPENPDRSYSNVWTLDNRLLLSITAPRDVAMSLTAEREMNARVFVHLDCVALVAAGPRVSERTLFGATVGSEK